MRSDRSLTAFNHIYYSVINWVFLYWPCIDSRLAVLGPRPEGSRANTADRESIQGQYRNTQFITLLLNNPTCLTQDLYSSLIEWRAPCSAKNKMRVGSQDLFIYIFFIYLFFFRKGVILNDDIFISSCKYICNFEEQHICHFAQYNATS